MNKVYLKSLAGYQCVNMGFYVLLSAIVGNGTLAGAVICFALGVVIHKYFVYKNGN